MHHPSLFEDLKLPPSIYDHSARLFLPGATSSPLRSSPPCSSCLPPSPRLVTTSLRAWVHLLCTAPRLLITAAALICEGRQRGWLASHRPGAASCVSKKNRARATCFPDSSFGNGRRCLIPWWLCFIPPVVVSRQKSSHYVRYHRLPSFNDFCTSNHLSPRFYIRYTDRVQVQVRDCH